MDDGSGLRLRVVPSGPIREITGFLADSWYQATFPYARGVRVMLHARQRIEVMPPPADET